MRNKIKKIMYYVPFVLIFGSAIAQAVAQDAFIQNLALVEGGNNPSATNSTTTSVGLYQMNQGAFEAVGLVSNDTGNWSSETFAPNPYGITNLSQLEANPAAQTYYAEQYTAQTYQAQSSYASTYLGQTVNGQVINQSALLTCGYLLGAGGCHQYLENGGEVIDNGVINQTLTNNANARIANGSQFDSTNETNGFTAVAAGPGNVNIGAGQANAAFAAVYCDPAIAKAQYNDGLAAVTQATVLADNSTTGYTFVDGNGVLQDSGLNGGTAAQSLLTGPNSFELTSCVDRLLSNPFNVIFQPPNLGALLSQLENVACNKAQSLFASVTQPITSALQDTSGYGGFYPGLGIGSLTGTVSSSASVGSGNGINIGVGGSSVNTSLSQIYNGNLNLNQDSSTLSTGLSNGLNIPSFSSTSGSSTTIGTTSGNAFANGLFGSNSLNTVTIGN
jgi:hypothetical protein